MTTADLSLRQTSQCKQCNTTHFLKLLWNKQGGQVQCQMCYELVTRMSTQYSLMFHFIQLQWLLSWLHILFVCVRVCVCVTVCVCVRTHMLACTCMWPKEHACMHACVCVCVRTHMLARTCMWPKEHACMHACVCVCVCMRVWCHCCYCSGCLPSRRKKRYSFRISLTVVKYPFKWQDTGESTPQSVKNGQTWVTVITMYFLRTDHS